MSGKMLYLFAFACLLAFVILNFGVALPWMQALDDWYRQASANSPAVCGIDALTRSYAQTRDTNGLVEVTATALLIAGCIAIFYLYIRYFRTRPS